MSARWVGAVAAAVALPLVYGALRTLFPARGPTRDERPLEDLRAEFRKWLNAGVVAWLLLSPVFGYCAWKLLVALGARVAAELPGGPFTQVPGGVEWGLAAAYFGMNASAPAVDALLRIVLRRRYRAFVRFQELQMGFSEAATMPLLVVLCAAGAGFVFLVSDTYVVVTPAAVVHDGFLSVFEDRYPHDEVAEIETAGLLRAPLGQMRPRRISVIHYADGRSWTIDMLPGVLPDARILAITGYVSERSGVPVREVEAIPRELF